MHQLPRHVDRRIHLDQLHREFTWQRRDIPIDLKAQGFESLGFGAVTGGERMATQT